MLMQKGNFVFVTIESDGVVGYIVHDDCIKAFALTLLNCIFYEALCLLNQS